MHLLKKISIVAIIVGVLGIAINTIFGYGTITYLERIRLDSGIWLYRFNYLDYLTNLKTSVQNTTVLQLEINPRSWDNTGDWDGLVNNLAYILNVIVMIGNIIIYPIRIGAYMGKTILAVMGVQVVSTAQNNATWLIVLFNTLQSLQIPYV